LSHALSVHTGTGGNVPGAHAVARADTPGHVLAGELNRRRRLVERADGREWHLSAGEILSVSRCWIQGYRLKLAATAASRRSQQANKQQETNEK
jgi:hypothetical protein